MHLYTHIYACIIVFPCIRPCAYICVRVCMNQQYEQNKLPKREFFETTKRGCGLVQWFKGQGGGVFVSASKIRQWSPRSPWTRDCEHKCVECGQRPLLHRRLGRLLGEKACSDRVVCCLHHVFHTREMLVDEGAEHLAACNWRTGGVSLNSQNGQASLWRKFSPENLMQKKKQKEGVHWFVRGEVDWDFFRNDCFGGGLYHFPRTD